MSELDDPQRGDELLARIKNKYGLRRLYEEIYGRYRQCVERSPSDGLVLELGSGAGFAKEFLPELITSDILRYSTVDLVFDARRLPFADRSLRSIVMLNVFHHIPDVAAFLAEASRCLLPGGRMLIVDQYPGWISAPVLRHLHHEPFEPDADEWSFASTGPLSGANGALAWIVFDRDRARFEQQFPSLALRRYEPHTPLRYWLSGGLKAWSLLPRLLFPLATRVDQSLLKLSRRFGSFLDVELEKLAEQN